MIFKVIEFVVEYVVECGDGSWQQKCFEFVRGEDFNTFWTFNNEKAYSITYLGL